METQDTGIPRAVEREVEAAALRLGLAGQTVLVAASGGLDSSVLAHALARVGRRHGLRVALGHVHHGLRGTHADADAEAVRRLAQGLEARFEMARIQPESLREDVSSRDRPTLQEAARALRYAALERLAEGLGARHVATAHQADDQAETVLLRLLRGTGPDGLAGIPERSPDGRIVRPLLRLSRDEIRVYATAHGLSWREDASNASDAYARNRLRNHWLPGLAADFNPRLLRAIADLAEAQRKDSEWIATAVAQEVARRVEAREGWLHVDAKDWSSLPEALARRVARELLVRAGAGRHVSRVHLERIQRFLCNARSGSRIELPGDLVLRRSRAGFALGPLPGAPARAGEDAC